jgi:hypothetical protein
LPNLARHFTCGVVNLSAIPRLGFLPTCKIRKEEKMKLKTFTASAATLFTFALFVMTAPTAHADDYCITNGAQTAHGCGYPSMETCRAASAGIGGTCAAAPSSKNPSDALGYQSKQPHSRSALRVRRESTGQ